MSFRRFYRGIDELGVFWLLLDGVGVEGLESYTSARAEGVPDPRELNPDYR